MGRKIDRREFLKIFGGVAAGTTAVATIACKGSGEQSASAMHEPPKDKMTMRQNPNSGDVVSLLGYGMMRLPVKGGGAARENPDADIDQEMVNRQVDYAIEHGVNYFDTSPAYCQGLSEHATGIALHRHPRSSYLIATKLSNFSSETWPAVQSRQMFENSLKELQVDYVDYLLLHGVGMGARSADGVDLDGLGAFKARYIYNHILDWLVNQKEEGRIRNLGFSYHGDISVFDILLKWHDEGRYHWDFVQIEMNYLDWHYADEINPRNTDAVYLYQELAKRNIPAVIMEPLLGGRLANIPNNIVKKMKARRPEDSIASWAFRFAGTPTKVLTVLSGMTYMEHLRDNIRTYAPLEPITKEENAFLMEIADDIYALKNIPCNECNYCMPCPYGIDIPAIFVHYNKMIKDGYMPHEKQDDEYRRQRRAFLVGYDRSIPRLRQADHCIGCGQCSPHCPQRIDIPREMSRIDRLVEKLKRDGKVPDKE